MIAIRTTTATVAATLCLVLATAGLASAAGGTPEALDAGFADTTGTECTGERGAAAICEERGLGHYCIWAEVLTFQVPDPAFCIYWPN